LYKKKKIFCIITARKGSKGIKQKNLKRIGKIPLFLHPMINARKSKYIDKIYLNTDSDKMIKIAVKNKFQYYKRPHKYSGDNAKSVDVLLDQIKAMKLENSFDYILLLEPTSPLTTNTDIDMSIKKLIDNNTYTSLLPVTKGTLPNSKFKFEIKNKSLYRHFNEKEILQRRQQFKEFYFLCGALYISKISSLMKQKSFLQKKTTYKVFNKVKSIEIDNIDDFEIIKALYKYLNKNEKTR